MISSQKSLWASTRGGVLTWLHQRRLIDTRSRASKASGFPTQDRIANVTEQRDAAESKVSGLEELLSDAETRVDGLIKQLSDETGRRSAAAKAAEDAAAKIKVTSATSVPMSLWRDVEVRSAAAVPIRLYIDVQDAPKTYRETVAFGTAWHL